MSPHTALERLLVAALVGMLIGLDCERAETRKTYQLFAGIHTFPHLEAFSRALTTRELAAALELAVISVIVLPLLPNQGYGPWQVWNPFNIWLMGVKELS